MRNNIGKGEGEGGEEEINIESVRVLYICMCVFTIWLGNAANILYLTYIIKLMYIASDADSSHGQTNSV